MNPGSPKDGFLNLKMVSLTDKPVPRYVAYTNTILVSILEWINCGTDTAETSPDNSMDNSTEEEDQV